MNVPTYIYMCIYIYVGVYIRMCVCRVGDCCRRGVGRDGFKADASSGEASESTGR